MTGLTRRQFGAGAGAAVAGAGGLAGSKPVCCAAQTWHSP